MIRFGGDTAWLGWDAKAEASAATHDAVIAFAYGMGNTEPPAGVFYPRPGASPDEEPSEVDNLFAPSIAEFNVGKWMQALNA